MISSSLLFVLYTHMIKSTDLKRFKKNPKLNCTNYATLHI